MSANVTILLKLLRDATVDDVERAHVELPIADNEGALELFNRMLDVLVVPRGEDEQRAPMPFVIIDSEGKPRPRQQG